MSCIKVGLRFEYKGTAMSGDLYSVPEKNLLVLTNVVALTAPPLGLSKLRALARGKHVLILSDTTKKLTEWWPNDIPFNTEVFVADNYYMFKED